MNKESEVLLKKKDVCRILNIHVSTLDKMVREGYLDCIKFSDSKIGTVRFKKSDVYDLIDKNLMKL